MTSSAVGVRTEAVRGSVPVLAQEIFTTAPTRHSIRVRLGRRVARACSARWLATSAALMFRQFGLQKKPGQGVRRIDHTLHRLEFGDLKFSARTRTTDETQRHQHIDPRARRTARHTCFYGQGGLLAGSPPKHVEQREPVRVPDRCQQPLRPSQELSSDLRNSEDSSPGAAASSLSLPE